MSEATYQVRRGEARQDWRADLLALALTSAIPSHLWLGLDMEELEEIGEGRRAGQQGLGRLAGK